MLEHGRISAEAANAAGDTLLHVAVTSRAIKVTALLIDEYGFDGEARNARGKTPLHIAATFTYHDDLAQLLIAKGSNSANTQDNRGNTHPEPSNAVMLW